MIGREGRDIAEEDASEYIAGYVIINDWTARDTEREELTVGLGPAKAKDFATSLGPWLVTPDELDHLALPDGRYELRLESDDRAANIFATPARTVTIDNTAPTPTLSRVDGGGAARGTLLLRAAATDALSDVAWLRLERSRRGLGAWTPIATVSASKSIGLVK